MKTATQTDGFGQLNNTVIILCFSIYVLNISEKHMKQYLHFLSFLHIDMTQVVEILPQTRQASPHFTLSISWLLVSWRSKLPGHQQL